MDACERTLYNGPYGNILLSCRNTSTVMMIDCNNRQTSAGKLGPPPLSGQHAPYLLENGHVLLFDNGPHRLDETFPYSRVLEIDPATNAIAWKFQEILSKFLQRPYLERGAPA